MARPPKRNLPPPPAPKVSARVTTYVYCPACGFVMLRQDDMMRCMNQSCDMRYRWFRVPTIELTPVSEAEILKRIESGADDLYATGRLSSAPVTRAAAEMASQVRGKKLNIPPPEYIGPPESSPEPLEMPTGDELVQTSAKIKELRELLREIETGGVGAYRCCPCCGNSWGDEEKPRHWPNCRLKAEIDKLES